MEGTKRKFVGGNWKSNNTLQVTQDLVNNVLNKIQFDTTKQDVVVSPVMLHVPWVKQNVQPNVQVAAQNSSLTGYGAFTGEHAPQHLKDFGLEWVILGHSERRQYYGEDSQVVAKKVKFALINGLKVIACIGERLEERESGNTLKVVTEQLDAIKGVLTEADWDNIVVAYEPVWAIGTGKVASPEQAQEVHASIRNYLKGISEGVSNATRIIYGGSVNGKNSGDLIQQGDIDGFLVGGASLKPEFADIVASCNN